MTPVEIGFLAIIALFGLIGAVRGFNREIGVTVMLLIGLLVLQLLDTIFVGFRDRVLAFIAGPDPAAQLTARAIMYTIFLIVLTFISYQGATLTFPTASSSATLGFFAGILNGWLFAGSIWYYAAAANWPFIPVCCDYDPLYMALSKLLPPELLPWQFLIVIIVIMLIIRVLH